MPDLEDAIILAAQAHRGQRDKAGQPYILHPLQVMLRMGTDEERTIAVLHDVIEDSEHTLDDLRQQGYAESVLAALDCLTHRPEESYETFVARAAANPLARRVKTADIEHNLDTSRLSEIGERDLRRLERYRRALDYLAGLEGGAPGSATE